MNASQFSDIAIVVLGQASVPLARRMMAVLPHATLYGLATRTTEVDRPFSNFGDTVRDLFRQGTPILGICAAGILIRTIAPLLSNKWQEPPVLAIAEDGSAVVPLLGGLQGANELARQIAAVLDISAAITTSGDLRFRTALLSPPAGYTLINPEDAKTFLADLLAGATVRLEGEADWLQNSQIPFSEAGELTIRVIEQSASEIQPNQLVYYRDQEIGQKAEGRRQKAEGRRQKAEGEERAEGRGQKAEEESIQNSKFIIHNSDNPSHLSPLTSHQNRQQGRLVIVGTGPGAVEWMTPEVKLALQKATDWVGYKTYLDLVEPLRSHQQRHESDNRVELDRARAALDLAATGKSVAVISSGDPGIFAMAAAVFEVLEQAANPAWQQIEIQVCPGISAMQAAAAQVGAPLGHDFCVISLSDILKSWEVIANRLSAAAQADFAIALYNPVSQQRTWQLEKAIELLLQWRSPQTPVVLARNLGRPGQATTVKSLGQLTATDADMRTVILIGSSKTRTIPHTGDSVWVYTPRYYDH